jgi:hypothetical protein
VSTSQRAVRRPTTASEKKAAVAARRESTSRERGAPPPPASARERPLLALPPGKEAVPAWSVQDLDSEEGTEVEDRLPQPPGRLQVSLSGFPRQTIRLSADQQQGALSILLRSQTPRRGLLPGAVEEPGSLQLEIENMEPAGVHRKLGQYAVTGNTEGSGIHILH